MAETDSGRERCRQGSPLSRVLTAAVQTLLGLLRTVRCAAPYFVRALEPPESFESRQSSDGVAGTLAVCLASRTRPTWCGAAGTTAAIIHRRKIAGPGTSPS